MFFINIIGFLMTNFSTTPKKDHNFSSLLNILRQSINSRDFSQIFDLIKEGVDLNKKYDSHLNYTLLHFAVEEGDVDLIKILIENGADVNAKGLEGERPLHLAVKKKNLNIINFLIEKKANPELLDEDNEHILHWAVRYANLSTIDLLLEKFDKFKQVDGTSYSIIHLALILGKFSKAKLILEKGVKIKEENEEYNETLHLAVKKKQIKIVELLIPFYQDINLEDHLRNIPLDYAIENKDFTMINLLIENGADFNGAYFINEDLSVFPLIHLAAKNGSEKGSLETIKLLLEKKEDIDIKDKDGKTPLHLAIENQDLTMIKFLIRMGADIYAESVQGTPSQYAFALSQKTGNSTIYETVLNATKLEMGLPEKYMYLPKVEASRFRNDSLLSDTQSLSRSLQKIQSKEPGLICSSCPKEVTLKQKHLLNDKDNYSACEKKQKLL